jgi:radical SAM protein with 4Fe4S-binding SPASM domain
MLNGFQNPPEHRDELYQCSAGMISFAIDPSGKLSLCAFLCGDTWDLRRGSFSQGWEVSLLEEQRKKITKKTKCWACEIKAMCGMCPANGELENENPEMPVDFLCQVAHLRAYALSLPVAPHGDCEYCKGGVGYKELMRSVATLRQVKDQAVRGQLRGALVT